MMTEQKMINNWLNVLIQDAEVKKYRYMKFYCINLQKPIDFSALT